MPPSPPHALPCSLPTRHHHWRLRPLRPGKNVDERLGEVAASEPDSGDSAVVPIYLVVPLVVPRNVDAFDRTVSLKLGGKAFVICPVDLLSNLSGKGETQLFVSYPTSQQGMVSRWTVGGVFERGADLHLQCGAGDNAKAAHVRGRQPVPGLVP